jgi:type IV fimbrial biogenesis protein FimT
MRTRSAGFTIVELMIVVLIVAILTALAVPSMRDMIRNQRVKTASFDVFAGLVLARSEAIKRNLSITLTANSGDWTKGWVATDANGQTVARQDPFDSTISVAGPGPTVVFSGIGRANGIASFTISSSFIPAANYRCVKLDMSGRAVSSTGACP